MREGEAETLEWKVFQRAYQAAIKRLSNWLSLPTAVGAHTGISVVLAAASCIVLQSGSGLPCPAGYRVGSFRKSGQAQPSTLPHQGWAAVLACSLQPHPTTTPSPSDRP